MRRRGYAGVTRRGRVRKTNEDAWLADPALGLFIVADGMGGHAAGALAAQVVVNALPLLVRQAFGTTETLGRADAVERLAAALAMLSNRLRKESEGRPGLSGMGATVVVALVRGGRALIGHMGDSRAYLFRGGLLGQLTTDHSLVSLLLEHGQIDAEEAAVHPARGQLTRYVGMRGEALPEAQSVELRPGDRLVLCSDGLTNMVTDAEMRAILSEDLTPSRTCRRLAAAANDAGGMDNISVVVVAPEAR